MVRRAERAADPRRPARGVGGHFLGSLWSGGLRNLGIALLVTLVVIGSGPDQSAQTSSKPASRLAAAPVRVRPLTAGERLVFNISWSNVPAAARLELETSGKGTLYGQEGFQLKTRVQTLNSGWLFGEIDNLYTTYVRASNALPYRLINWIRQGRGEVKQGEETVEIDQNGSTASFSSFSGGSGKDRLAIPSGTLDLPSLLLALRRQPLPEGGRARYHILYNRELVVVEAELIERRRLETSLGTFDSVCLRLLPRKFSQFQTILWLTDDAERTPLQIRARSPLGEIRAELISATMVRPAGAEAPSLGAATGPASEIFSPGERLGYEISWGEFINLGRASFEIRQQGMLNNQPVLELHGEASSIGVARALFTVNDQITSVVLARQLTPLRSEVRLREGSRSKFDVATFNQSAGIATLNNGTSVRSQPGTVDLLSLFYNLRAANLKPGESRRFDLLDANHRPQAITVRAVAPETIDGRQTTRHEILNDQGALLATGWITSDQQRLPLKFSSRLRIGEIHFKLVSVSKN
ncbi:MAG: DUF3108 domain-containing protein [Acidobacteriota bacterium]